MSNSNYMKISASSLSALASFLLLAFHLPFQTISQSWEKFDISSSGCSAYFPYEPEWELSYAEDSSLVWVGEAVEDDIYYGVICVEFSLPFYEATEDELIYVAEDYLDYLRGEFSIVSHTGYETGYWMDSNIDATGIEDYWEDNEGDPWVVMSWIDPFNMAVMYIYSSPELETYKNKDFFLNSFTFPE
jgi:hypothetical protein